MTTLNDCQWKTENGGEARLVPTSGRLHHRPVLDVTIVPEAQETFVVSLRHRELRTWNSLSAACKEEIEGGSND